MPFFDDHNDPYSTHTVMGWIRSWGLGRTIEAELGDTDSESTAAIESDARAREKAQAETLLGADWNGRRYVAAVAARKQPVGPKPPQRRNREPELDRCRPPEPAAEPDLEAEL